MPRIDVRSHDPRSTGNPREPDSAAAERREGRGRSVNRSRKRLGWRSGWLTHVEQRSIAAAAEQLGISVGKVYVGRSRVMGDGRRPDSHVSAARETRDCLVLGAVSAAAKCLTVSLLAAL